MAVKKYCEGCKIKVNPGGPFGLGCNCIEFEDGFYCDTCAAKMVEGRRERLVKPKQQREDKEEYRKPKLKIRRREY